MNERWKQLLETFDDPDGIIDDAEELLDEIPDMLRRIQTLEAQVEARDKLINEIKDKS